MNAAIALKPMLLVAIVLFVVLLSLIIRGRVLSALIGMGGVMLIVGVLLLFGGWMHLRGPVAWPEPSRIGEVWPMPGAPSHSRTVVRVDPALPAERPDQSLDTAIGSPPGKQLASRDASGLTDEPPGPPRPAWMDAPMGRFDGVYRTRVTVGPWMSRQECESERRDVLRDAVATYAEQYLGDGKGKYVDLPLSYITENIVRGEWEERRQDTIHTMISLHELLEFDRDVNRTIEASYKRSVVGSRLGYLSAGGGTLLGLLTIAFGYLKLDTLTRGYYTGRLRLTAGAAILALAVIVGLLVMV